MAAAASFVASDEAAYITGIVPPVDGGMSMQRALVGGRPFEAVS